MRRTTRCHDLSNSTQDHQTQDGPGSICKTPAKLKPPSINRDIATQGSKNGWSKKVPKRWDLQPPNKNVGGLLK